MIDTEIRPRAGSIYAKGYAAYMRNHSDNIPDVLAAEGRAEYLSGIVDAMRDLGEEPTSKKIKKGIEMKKLSKSDSQKLNEEIATGNKSVAELAEEFGVNKAAVYARIKYYKNKALDNDEIATDTEIQEEPEEPAEPEEPVDIDDNDPEIPEEPIDTSDEYSPADLFKALGYLFTTVGNLLK